MSIWASTVSFSENRSDDDPLPPLVYVHSGHKPGIEGERGGFFGLAEIPAYVFGADDDERAEPFLRVSLTEEDVILDRQQVREVWEYLGRWLERTQPVTDEDQTIRIPGPETEDGHCE